jgi:hypothetical protein
MFAKSIVTSDAFLDLEHSTRCLYFMLCMIADDDGFVNSAKAAMRQAGATRADLDELIAQRFILAFDNGVVVIKHWHINNKIQKDRYKQTTYTEEKALLKFDEKGAYTEAFDPCIQNVSNSDTKCIQSGYKMDTQVSIGKGSLGKCSVVEGSSTDGDGEYAEEPVENFDEDDQLKLQGGKLGRNVVYLSDRQMANLLDILGLDAYNRYVTRLAEFIIDKKAHVKNHYETILKWYKEDCKTS